MIDFFSTELKLGIEVDGASHNQEDSNILDENRTKILNSHGITIIRFKDYEVIEDIEKVLRELKNKIMKLRTA